MKTPSYLSNLPVQEIERYLEAVDLAVDLAHKGIISGGVTIPTGITKEEISAYLEFKEAIKQAMDSDKENAR
jgi:hypothetical protein